MRFFSKTFFIFVAWKFLPHNININDDERQRFVEETKATAAINHPNVRVIHDIQEHDGQQFIVMEYVEGKTLREISVAKVLNLRNALDYAIQIGEALQAAHEKGVIYRDIKSENIMVTAKNQVKVMDFGLAKSKCSLKLTKSSSTLGTLAYMSPEQINSSKAAAKAGMQRTMGKSWSI